MSNTATENPDRNHGRKSIWDNDLPAGDSPPMPRWPLTVSIAVYSLWMIFLVSMAILRLSQ